MAWIQDGRWLGRASVTDTATGTATDRVAEDHLSMPSTDTTACSESCIITLTTSDLTFNISCNRSSADFFFVDVYNDTVLRPNNVKIEYGKVINVTIRVWNSLSCVEGKLLFDLSDYNALQQAIFIDVEVSIAINLKIRILIREKKLPELHHALNEKTQIEERRSKPRVAQAEKIKQIQRAREREGPLPESLGRKLERAKENISTSTVYPVVLLLC